MLKLSSVSLLVALLGLSACEGSWAGTGPVDQDPAALARAKFESDVKPRLQASCQSCHGSISGGIGPGFLIAPDIYQSLMDSGLVVGGDPSMSELYTYGQSATHTGTELTVEEAELVRAWIEMEPVPVGPPPEDRETTKLTPIIGANSFDLALLNDGLEGASLTFTFERLTAGIYLSGITIHAGVNGVHIYHPLFTYWSPDAHVDPVDSFYGMDVTVNPNESKPLGGGTLVLVDVPLDAQLSIHFVKLENGVEAMDPGDPGTGPTGGCVNVAGFTTQAAPQLDATCFSCHGGANATARNAFDLSQLRDTSAAGQAAVCGQVKGKINLASPVDSILFQRVEPGQITNHPLTISDPTQFMNFRDPIVSWANTESN